MSQARCELHFRSIRREYFPRWDRRGIWRIKFHWAGCPTGDTGYCDSTDKLIHLDRAIVSMPDSGLRALIIHEICHDIGGARHGLGWAKRMTQAANRAIAIGEIEVAGILRGDLYSYAG